MTVAELLAAGASSLTAREGLAAPRREARFLLSRLLGRSETWLVAHPEVAVESSDEVTFRQWIRRRSAGEPAHLIVGSCPFWGREFAVTKDVLIPRPETEVLVERVLNLALTTTPRVLELATGSGCLAVTLALELRTATVVASDLSVAALAVARSNVTRHGASVRLVGADLATPITGGWNLLVANLPYIPTSQIDTLTTEVRDWEPRSALDGGEHGCRLLRELVADLPRLLAPGGWAALELGPGQAGPISEEAARGGLLEVDRCLDAGGVERVLVLQHR